MIIQAKLLSIFFIGFTLFDFSFIEDSIPYATTIQKINNKYKFSLTRTNGNMKSKDNMYFSNKIFNFKVIDINNDGVQDFCIGFIKTTRWNTVPKPKLHIYSHKNGKIYPIWRSSMIGKNLVDFDIDFSDNLPGIKILENPKSKIFNIALYRWKSFGLKFVKYLEKNLDSLTSIKLLRSKQ